MSGSRYRFKKKEETYLNTNYLCHYGRSIRDGAPGVGTGNWRRGGGTSYNQNNTPKTKEELIDHMKQNGFSEESWSWGNKTYKYYTKKFDINRGEGKKPFKASLTISEDDLEDDLEESNWNEALDRINDVEKNIEKLDKQFRKDASEYYFTSDNPLEWPWAYQPDADYPSETQNMSKKDAISHFEKHLGTYKSGGKRYFGEISYGFAGYKNSLQVVYVDGDSFYGHVISAWYDEDKKKFRDFAVEG